MAALADTPPCPQMRRFERIGLTQNQAEALTTHVTELICTNKEKISEQFVSKAALERVGHSLCLVFAPLWEGPLACHVVDCGTCMGANCLRPDRLTSAASSVPS